MPTDPVADLPILVVGATGRIGRSLVRDLTGRGRRVRALSRAPDRHAPEPRVEWVRADLRDTSSLAAAVAGAGAMFLLTSPGEEMVEAESNAIAAAVRAGVGHVVKESALGASDHTRSPVARWHFQVEQVLKASGVAWTILRPHYFMDNLLAEAPELRSTGELRSPVGDARVPFIDSLDIAAVAAQVLSTGGFRSETLVLTGEAALTYTEVAAELSTFLGRSIAYRAETLDASRQRLEARGLPPWEIESLLAIWGYQQRGGPTSAVSADVRRVLGREPRAFRAFLEAHRSEFETGRSPTHP